VIATRFGRTQPGNEKVPLHDQCPRARPVADHLLTPQNAALLLIDYQPQQPATAHFRLAGHPVVRWYEPGEDWYWCHLDRLVFELGSAPAAPSHS
jgi:hypothetical protein